MTRNPPSLLPLVLLWLAPTSFAFAERPQILPGGVLDPSGKTGYVTNADGGIDALDLSTGDVRWSSREARRPVLVVGDRLYAWTMVSDKPHVLRIVTLDLTEKGKRVQESEPVTFPDWISLEEGHGHSFAEAWRLEKGKVILEWEARAWYSGGARPTPRKEAAARKQATGRVVFEPETGRVEMPPVENRAEAIKLPQALEKLVVRWQGLVGDRFAALVLEEEAGEQLFVLRWWDPAGQPIGDPKELLRGKRLLVLPTADSQYLCLRAATNRPEEKRTPVEQAPFAWSVIDPATAERIGTVPYEAGTQALVIVSPRAYYLVTGPLKGPLTGAFVQPRILKASDLKTGKVLWERPVEGKRHVAPP
jgi:hypothetical protein